ncbi:MAG: M1 family metallopeptidase [Bacteroidetes bacterium]|nr:M1 family metallopeptidase [Bacteroidota bacterium]
MNKPLLPGNRVIIKTPFFVKLPSAEFSRLGHIGQAYAITQWYPKPAVYDQHGWHPMPYLNQGEFYSEFGTFDVTITLPQNYVVGATGECQTPSELTWMNELSKEPNNFTDSLHFPSSSKEYKTIQYKQNNIHDFAWFADKRFHVRKGSLTLPKSGNEVTTWALFTNSEPNLWRNAVRNINDAIYHYSEVVGEYPYSQCTAIDGTISAGTGMEYPMITIIGKSYTPFLFDMVVAHEVGHNWFYGILGSNERDHPWMDEGMNSFVEALYSMRKYPPSEFGNLNEFEALGTVAAIVGANQFNYKQMSHFEYQLLTSSFTNQAIEKKAVDYSFLNYGIITYKKTAIAFNYLQNYLGDSIFSTALQNYYQEFKFKHPYPIDVKNSFEKTSGKDLSWFFTDIFSSTTSQDLKFKDVKKVQDGFEFKVIDKKRNLAPYSISGFKNHEIVSTSWFEKEQLNQPLKFICLDCDEIIIDAQQSTLDVNRKNNSSKRNYKLKFSMLPKIHAFDRPSLFATPVVAWNHYNEFMLGASIYNMMLPFKRIEYTLTPLYAFGDKTINGIGSIQFTFPVSSSFIHKITLKNNFRKFSYSNETYRNREGSLSNEKLGYIRYSPELIFTLKKSNVRSSIQQLVKIQSIHLWEENVIYRITNGKAAGSIQQEYKDFYRLKYHFLNKRTVDPFSIKLQMEANADILKADVEFNYHFNYKMKNKGADVRIFSGTMIKDNLDGLYGYFLSDRNGVRGSNDYAYDELYFGRSETQFFLSQQMALRQGAFKIYTPFGAYREWILAANFSIDFPIPLPLKLYGDIGTTSEFKEDIKNVYDINATFSYNAGVCLSLFRNVVEVYFPLVRSAEINKFLEANNSKYVEQIRFVFNLNQMNPLNFRNQFFQ